MLDWDKIDCRLTAACDHYETTAPTVSAWCNDLFVRLHENADAVRVSELSFAGRLVEDGEWMHPNFAANGVYKIMHRLGQDTTGHAGF